jgi:hypothetical protein
MAGKEKRVEHAPFGVVEEGAEGQDVLQVVGLGVVPALLPAQKRPHGKLYAHECNSSRLEHAVDFLKGFLGPLKELKVGRHYDKVKVVIGQGQIRVHGNVLLNVVV